MCAIKFFHVKLIYTSIFEHIQMKNPILVIYAIKDFLGKLV
ncbi:unnamed protein product [Larinioides sclopetarius]|uniref:Uncharacterized protein n=1 Tax=Larinioides sclopetarius TaxID=280406 RepID=A0AAV2B5N1_9ARAC